MTAPRLALFALLATGCGRDYVLGVQQPELILSAGTLEAPLTAVGESSEIQFGVQHVSGPLAKLVGLDVQPILGDAFTVLDAFPIEIEPDASATLTARFTPVTRGVAMSRISVVTNGQVDRLNVDIRGEAGDYLADLWPARLDYGPVEGSVTQTAYIENAGDLPLSLEAIDFGDASATLSTALPLPAAIAAGATLDVPLTVSGTAPIVEYVSFTLDHATVDPLFVVANSCEYGDAGAFDHDGDGVSRCAGDCDDTAATVFPGATETANGVDENCDTVIDEGTTAFDDDRDGYTENEGDCDDEDAAQHPGAVERDNGKDDNCDGVVL